MMTKCEDCQEHHWGPDMATATCGSTKAKIEEIVSKAIGAAHLLIMSNVVDGAEDPILARIAKSAASEIDLIFCNGERLTTSAD